MTRPLIIVGASARGAAFSARAAGFEPWCADLFADTDLAAVGPAHRIPEYPSGLIGVLQRSPQGPWMYTGALENEPDLIDALAEIRHLYGNRAQVLRRARNPMFWTSALVDAGLAAPRVAETPDELSLDGTWLRKPLRSASGSRITVWQARQSNQASTSAADERWYFQQYIAGQPISAVYVAAEGEAVLLGVTRQLAGDDWRSALAEINAPTNVNRSRGEHPGAQARALPFRYLGSIGPLLLDDFLYRKVQRIGQVLSLACGLVGLFGVDAILDSEDVWPLEINPRYTASIEVLERASVLRTRQRRALRLLAVEWHEAACCFRQLPAALGQSTEAVSGKLIYYALHDGEFSTSAARWVALRNLGHARPAVADIPAEGAALRAGQPVLTLLADGTSMASVADELRNAAEELGSMI